MSPAKMLMPFTFLVLTSGCMMSHDQYISRVELKDECDFGQDALFHNAPYYFSKNTSPSSLAELFQNYHKSVALVRLVKDGNRLRARFYDAANTEITYGSGFKGKEYEYESDGKRFIIGKGSSCGHGEAGAGCGWSRIELSCTQDGNLAVKETGSGVMLIGLVVPLVMSGSSLALYQRVPGTSNDTILPNKTPPLPGKQTTFPGQTPPIPPDIEESRPMAANRKRIQAPTSPLRGARWYDAQIPRASPLR
jgi:hypothetical protein